MKRRTRNRVLGCAGGVLALTALSIVGNAGSSTHTPASARTTTATSASAVPAPPPGTALAALAALPVKGRAPMTGYSRDQFGPAWADVDGNGCDTRDDVLARDLTGETVGGDGCTVLTGTLAEPYSGTTIVFRRGVGTSSAVQIDHVVALGDAWQTGAQQWDAVRRERFANDPINLLAVDGPLNEAKGDGDAATWLPPNTSYRCAYVARQVAVKRDYGLWVTAAERDAARRVLDACPDQPLPSGADEARPTVTPPPAPISTPPAATFYPNCTAARAAGVAPLHRGDPGYRAGLDRNNDGMACE